MLLKSYMKNIAKLFGRFLPSRIFSTFFGIGYLPSWQNHWASLLVLIICYSLYSFIYGIAYFFYDIHLTGILIAVFFLKISVILFLSSIVLIFIFQVIHSGSENDDAIVIHIALGQIMVVALSMPAIIDLYYQVSGLYNKVCIDIFICPKWMNSFIYLLIFFFLPFVFFNFINSIKPWPISSLQLLYNNCFSILFEAIVYVIYTVILIYLIAFIWGDLTALQALVFNNYVFTFYQGS